jgi:hypothetical protein
MSVSISCDIAHALLDRALHADEADAVLVLHQLADARTRRLPRWSMSSTDAAAVLELDQVADRLEDVALGEDLGRRSASSMRRTCSSA